MSLKKFTGSIQSQLDKIFYKLEKLLGKRKEAYLSLTPAQQEVIEDILKGYQKTYCEAYQNGFSNIRNHKNLPFTDEELKKLLPGYQKFSKDICRNMPTYSQWVDSILRQQLMLWKNNIMGILPKRFGDESGIRPGFPLKNLDNYFIDYLYYDQPHKHGEMRDPSNILNDIIETEDKWMSIVTSVPFENIKKQVELKIVTPQRGNFVYENLRQQYYILLGLIVEIPETRGDFHSGWGIPKNKPILYAPTLNQWINGYEPVYAKCHGAMAMITMNGNLTKYIYETNESLNKQIGNLQKAFEEELDVRDEVHEQERVEILKLYSLVDEQKEKLEERLTIQDEKIDELHLIIEKQQRQIYDLIHPPIEPNVYKNPFDDF